MKTYVLTVSQVFPKTHKRSGQDTGFITSIKEGEKVHTIRGNYELWSKRFEKINEGKAFLSVRVWEGVPYNSNQREVLRFDKSHGIGIEKIIFDDYLYGCQINGDRFSVNSEMIAENDGLNSSDFEEWFKGYDLTEEMAIIHFTDFRYNRVKSNQQK